MKKKNGILLGLSVGLLCLISYKIYRVFFYAPDTVMVTSVSSDGHYALTSDTGRRITLWDLKDHKAKLISTNGNIYSAYFIKNTDDFMWQDLKKNEVSVENVNGTIIQLFNPGFPSYGEVMTSDLQYYIASNDNWNIFVEHNGQIKRMLEENSGGFLGAGKLMNLLLTKNDQYCFTVGIGAATTIKAGTMGPNKDEITRWDYQTLTPIMQYTGTSAKAVAAISPDDRYVVGGDEGSGGYIWNLKTAQKLFDLDDLKWGHVIGKQGDNLIWSQKGLIPQPAAFGWKIDMWGTPYYQEKEGIYDAIFALKFIDNDHYLRFTYDTPWALLYNVKNPQPIKYIDLGNNPFPSMADYSADESIDTSPNAHILVTGQYNANGIIEYQYDPQTQTLTRVWTPHAPSFLAKWFWMSE